MLDGSRIRQSRTSDSAERYLRSLIFTGQMGPGDMLPPERELAAQLGIARITLRVALKALETSGLVTIKLGSKGGPQVNDARAIGRCWDRWRTAHQAEIDEILEFRRAIEEKVAALAAAQRTEADLAALEAASRLPEEGWSSFAKWHFGFHDALARAAHNRYLESAVMATQEELFFPVAMAMERQEVEMVQQVHERIVAAVRDRDVARAVEEMGIHLEYSEAMFASKGRRH
jgi:GntR family transcriptional repressor for pyruvate dehydrogenase complex